MNPVPPFRKFVGAGNMHNRDERELFYADLQDSFNPLVVRISRAHNDNCIQQLTFHWEYVQKVLAPARVQSKQSLKRYNCFHKLLLVFNNKNASGFACIFCFRRVHEHGISMASPKGNMGHFSSDRPAEKGWDIVYYFAR